jgi:1-acyl-sn-glycerol-3-phosphate acyltransferase
VAAAFGKENYMHFMAKLELQKVPMVGAVLKKCGICFVDRGKSDIDAIRSMMKYLKHGEKVFMFPEGTRAGHDNEVEAKTGAVRIASKMKVPILPVYIPRGKKPFAKVELLVGEPYQVEAKTHEEYEREADGIMERIYELRDGTNG